MGAVRDSGNDTTEDEDNDPGEGQENSVDDSIALFLAASQEKSEETCSERDDSCSKQDTERDVFELVNIYIADVTFKGFDCKE